MYVTICIKLLDLQLKFVQEVVTNIFLKFDNVLDHKHLFCQLLFCLKKHCPLIKFRATIFFAIVSDCLKLNLSSIFQMFKLGRVEKWSARVEICSNLHVIATQLSAWSWVEISARAIILHVINPSNTKKWATFLLVEYYVYYLSKNSQ